MPKIEKIDVAKLALEYESTSKTISPFYALEKKLDMLFRIVCEMAERENATIGFWNGALETQKEDSINPFWTQDSVERENETNKQLNHVYSLPMSKKLRRKLDAIDVFKDIPSMASQLLALTNTKNRASIVKLIAMSKNL